MSIPKNSSRSLFHALQSLIPYGFIALAVCFLASVAAAMEPTRPNFLIIMVDDLRSLDRGILSDSVETPNLDRFSDEGIHFSRAYANFPACGPSRNSLLSGLRPETTGALLNTHHSIRAYIPSVVPLPAWLRQHGYRTIGMGKIFHSDQDARSWDAFFPFPSTVSGHQLRYEERGPAWEFVEAPDEGYPDGWMVDTAGKWLLQHDNEAPFFMMIGLLKPHLAFVAPKKDLEALAGPPPEPLVSEMPEGSPSYAGHTSFELRPYDNIPDGRGSFDAETKEALRLGYAACVRFIDRQIGELLDSLEQSGFAHNTHVIVIGDHGFHLGENGIFGKDTVFEASLEAYLALRLAGKDGRQPAKINGPVELLDVYPTILELADLSAPYALDGVSLLNPERNDLAFSMVQRHGAMAGFSVRGDRFRYTRWIDLSDGSVRAEELFDYTLKYAEEVNLAPVERYQGVVNELSTQMDRHLAKGRFKPGSEIWGLPLKPPAK